MDSVCVISIYVNDLKVGTKFYSRTLGLTVKKELPYLVVFDNGGTDLVLCQAEEAAVMNYPNRSSVVLGFPTTNLAQSIDRFQSGGVSLIHSEPQDFPGGKFVAFRDPAGNVHELIEFNK